MEGGDLRCRPLGRWQVGLMERSRSKDDWSVCKLPRNIEEEKNWLALVALEFMLWNSGPRSWLGLRFANGICNSLSLITRPSALASEMDR